MNFTINDFYSIVPELAILIGAILTLLVDLFLPKRARALTSALPLITIAVAAYFLLGQMNSTFPHYAFDKMWISDPISVLLKLTICLLTFLLFVYSRSYLKEYRLPMGEYYTLVLLSMIGMMVLVSSNHLLLLFMGLELSSLPTYALVAIQRDSSESTEAAMKYYLMGAVATGVLLYAISLLYGLTNELYIHSIVNDLQTAAPQQMILVVIVAFIVATICFKLGIAPFHMWAPDVYQGAATPVTLFISSAPKIAIFGMLIRLIVEMLPGLQFDWQRMLILVAIFSIFLGNITAIVQTNFKRMLAYSSIAHMGYMILGILTGTSKGYAAALFYMISYALLSAGAFAIISLLGRNGLDTGNIRELKGLNSRNPVLALMMLLLMFSMAGIPPMVGFFAKLGVLEALIASHFTWLAVFALIMAVIGSYYYLAIVKVMYFEDPEITDMPIAYGWDMKLAITFNGLLALLLGVFPSALFELCKVAIAGS